MEADAPGKAVGVGLCSFALNFHEENEKMLGEGGCAVNIGRETGSRVQGFWATVYTLEGIGERLRSWHNYSSHLTDGETEAWGSYRNLTLKKQVAVSQVSSSEAHALSQTSPDSDCGCGQEVNRGPTVTRPLSGKRR